MMLNQIKQLMMRRGVVLALIFLTAFAYIFIFTVGINPHWESNLFIEGAFSVPASVFLNDVFQIGSEYATASHGPINPLYYRIIFFFFGYDYFYYRVCKSLFFAGTILFLFLIYNRFLKKKYSLAASIFVLFSFPLFIQTLVFDEGFIIGEFFKMVTLYLFLLDIERPKTDLKWYVLMLFTGLFAIRTYTATFSLIGIIFLYLLCKHRDKIKRYAFLIVYLFLTKIPIPFSTSSLQFSDSAYGFKLNIITKFFLNNVLEYVTSPFPSLTDLYYLPLAAILSFFGFWLLLFFILLTFSAKKINKNYPSLIGERSWAEQEKQGILFFSLWFFCEIPILFVLPEHAIRYTAGLLSPLIGIFCLFFQKTMLLLSSRKIITRILVIFFLFAIATNIWYITLFRATWGSSFIGMEKVSNFILASEEEGGKSAKLYYYATSAAPEYYVVDKTRLDKYTVSSKVIPTAIRFEEFTDEYLLQQQNENISVYVVKRISSFKNSEYPPNPPIDIKNFLNLEQVKVIEGKGDNVFDRVLGMVSFWLNIPYSPNVFYVYKVKSDRK